MGERREYLSPEELTPEFQEGMIEELPRPHTEILEIVDRKRHEPIPGKPGGAIMMRVAVEPTSVLGKANLTGYAARSVKIGKDKYREEMQAPAHIKNSIEFTIADPGYMIDDSNTNPSVLDEDAEKAIRKLEFYRVNRIVWMCLTMIGERAIVYMDGETVDESEHIFSVSYEDDIPVQPPVDQNGNDFNDTDDINALVAFRNIKAKYRDTNGINFLPTVAYGSPATMAKILSVPEVKAAYKPLQSSDPDRMPETFDMFMFDGIMFVTLHTSYPVDDNGVETLAPAIPDGHLAVTVLENPETGQRPIIWHSVDNMLNGFDGSAARRKTFTEGKEHPAISIAIYDNGIPMPEKRGIIQMVQVYDPTP